MEQTVGKFRCASCGRQYTWKPEYAGRKVKCKCGNIMVAPTEPPKPPEPEADDMEGLFELAETEKTAARAHAVEDTGLHCPNCHGQMEVGHTVCPSCGFDLKTGLKAQAQKATQATAGHAAHRHGTHGHATVAHLPPGRIQFASDKPVSSMQTWSTFGRHNAVGTAPTVEETIGGSPLRELYVPAALVILGLLMQAVLWNEGGSLRTLPNALPAIGIALIFNLVLCLIGVGIMFKLLELSLGSPGPAALKFVAICLLPAALAQFIGNLVGPDSMFVRVMIASLLMTPLTVVAFLLLFDFAWDEALYCTIAVWLVNQWAVPFIVGFLLSGGLGGGPTLSSAVVSADKEAREALTWNTAVEANEFLADNGNRLFQGLTHDASLKMVADLKDAGAVKQTVIRDGGEATALIVTLPSKSTPRAKLFSYIRQYETKDGVKPKDLTTDEGQTYHTFEFHNLVPPTPN